MIENLTINTQQGPTAGPPSQESRDAIHYVCRVISALAWIAIMYWLLTPRETRWASAAGDAGLAWILLTGGGYFAEQTMRSFVKLWKAYPTSRHEDATCTSEEHSPK